MKPERILVIAKNDGLTLQVVKALRQAGYRVLRARDGYEGLEKIKASSPDLVVMERELLPVEKQDPLSRIRQVSYLPIITFGSDHDPTDMLEFVADVYMVNPPNLKELTARVRALLRRKYLDDLPLGGFVIGDGEISGQARHLLSQERGDGC